MKDDRLRIPVEVNYLTALGRAAYIFADLEWAAVYVIERLKPGYVQRLGRKTARQISDDLTKYVQRIEDETVRDECATLATRFGELVTERNALLHATPMTTDSGEQRLGRRPDGQWEPAAIDDLADDFAASLIALSGVFHHRLSSPRED